MKKVREYTFMKEFYLNDIHESNFIIDKSSQSVRVVDLDSCKINDNYPFPSKYLSTLGIIGNISKYPKETKAECGAIYKPTEDTELYCYIIMILNCLYQENINSMSLESFYDYLEYLESIGIEKELIYIFERIASNSHNINPYELLDSLTPFLGRSNNHVYKHIKRKTS